MLQCSEFFFSIILKQRNYFSIIIVSQNVIRFWLDRGVSGFRVDAVPHLFEIAQNEKGRLPDEPLSGNTKDTDDWGYLKHIFTVDQPETIGNLSEYK